MPNPALDQLTRSLFTTVAPIIIGCGIVGLLLGGLVKWMERRATRLGESIRRTRQLRSIAKDVAHAPHCPECNEVMVRRTAKRGGNRGSEFWGCAKYPKCKGTRAIG